MFGTMDRKSGWEPIEGWKEPCADPAHNPPTHMVIPAGYQYRHICPTCGAETVIAPSQVHM